MKIKNIEMTKFRSFDSVTLDTDKPVVLICGRNGVGKTSVREALRWLLTGRNQVTDKRGSGSALLAPQGTSIASVAADIEGVGRAARMSAEGVVDFMVDGFTGDMTAQFDGLYSKLAIKNKVVVEAALNTQAFFDMEHAEAKTFLLDLLDVRVDVKGAKLTLDQVEALYQKAYAERRDAKVVLKNHAVPPPPKAVEFYPPEKIEEKLGDIRTKIEGVQTEVGHANGRRDTLTKQIARSDAYKPYVHPDYTLSQATAALTAARSRMASATSDLEAAKAARATTGDPTQSLRQGLVLKLESHDPKKGCVLCADVPCKTPVSAFTKQAQAITVEIIAASDAPADAPLSDPMVDELSAASTLVQTLTIIVSRYETDAVLAASHTGDVEAWKKELAEVPDTTLLSAELEQLRARVVVGEGKLRDARTFLAEKDAHEAGLDKKGKLEGVVATLEEQVELYGPKGLRAKALETSLGAFTGKINGYLSKFGWALAFSVDPWQVQVNGRPYSTYSKSEQLRIGMGLQLAIASVSGLSFAVVDEIDMLDVENRTAATVMLVNSGLDQVFALSTREPGALLEVKNPKVRAFRLAKDAEGQSFVQSAVDIDHAEAVPA